MSGNTKRRQQSMEQHASGSMLELESLRREYANGFERSNKLDNKVYIIITFCGFLFVFITSLFSGLLNYRLDGTTLKTVLTLFSLSSCVAVVIAYVVGLVWFVELLIPEQLERIDPDLLQAEKLHTLSDDAACARLIDMYRRVINHNLERLHLRCNRLTHGLKFVVATCILSFLAYALQLVVNML